MSSAKRLMAAATLLCAALTPGVSADTNIDQGFALDGKTTYCEGAQASGSNSGSGGALGLTNLPADSAGKCPVSVTITLAATTVKQKDTVNVTWMSKVNTAVTNNLFPSTVDVATKIPKAVVSSVMKACKVGTNCQSVIDSVPTGDASAEAGVYDASGSKTMRPNQFSFSDVGDFIIVGKVVLPGDTSLNISATEFFAFQKITVVDVNTVITPSPSPSPSPSPTPAPTPAPTPTPVPSAVNGSSADDLKSSHSDGHDESNVITPSDVGAGTVKPASDDNTSSTPNGSSGKSGGTSNESSGSSSIDASTSSNAGGVFGSNSVLLGCVLAGCFVACVVGFAFVMRRRAETKMSSDKGLDSNNPPDSRGSVGMLDSGEFAVKYLENNSMRSNEQPKPTMSISPAPVVFDASLRNSELNLSADEYVHRDVSEVSSLASEQYSETMSNFDDGTHVTDNNYLQSFDWSQGDSEYQRPTSMASKESEYQRPTSMASEATGRGFSVASSAQLSDLSENRPTRLESEVSVDSYAFGPSPRSSEADSYLGGYSESSRPSSRISGMSMYSDV
uniref:Uncharacterized protein n=1 Tax=Globisporangium ultimum (strain ATCC 200006 / CBS 805.95 / DAOM BR144) TaxID=431595 RepID=K3WKM2_GLOUD